MLGADPVHNEAMQLAERAFLAKMRGHADEAATLTREAFEFERRAAESLANAFHLEPSRAVLYRSAASLALECNEPREAERLIAAGLAGNPPPDIADELRDLYEDTHFRRHLQVRGVSLAEDELQLSIAGRAVGLGIALLDPLWGRVQALEKLLFRTAERLANRPFREKGAPKKPLRQSLELYLSVPRNGSMAVSFKLGGPSPQNSLPGMSYPADVIEGLLGDLDAFTELRMDSLRDRITDTSYLVNFVGLAKIMAPDGDKVTTVGLTALRQGHHRAVALRRPSHEYGAVVETGFDSEVAGIARVSVTVEGRLKYADDTHEKAMIKIVDDRGKGHFIIVPEGMMSDIVKPLWDTNVVVSGYRMPGARITLSDIREAA